jgi:hypothetical protein
MQTLLVRTVEDITILQSHRQQGQGLDQRHTFQAPFLKKENQRLNIEWNNLNIKMERLNL